MKIAYSESNFCSAFSDTKHDMFTLIIIVNIESQYHAVLQIIACTSLTYVQSVTFWEWWGAIHIYFI